MIALAAVVAALVGHPVGVTCQPLHGPSGWYRPAENRIYLDAAPCAAIERLRAGRLYLRDGDALLTLAHEAMHASGLPNADNETLTECRAVRVVGQVAALLGIPRVSFLALRPAIMEAHRYVRTLPGYGAFACPRGAWLLSGGG